MLDLLWGDPDLEQSKAIVKAVDSFYWSICNNFCFSKELWRVRCLKSIEHPCNRIVLVNSLGLAYKHGLREWLESDARRFGSSSGNSGD